MAKNTASPDPGPIKVDMDMLPTEFAELRAQAAEIGRQDHRLGQLLTTIVLHLGHAHGLDAATEDAKAAESTQEGTSDAN